MWIWALIWGVSAALDLSRLTVGKCNETTPHSCVLDGTTGQIIAYLTKSEPTCVRADKSVASIAHGNVFRWAVPDQIFSVGFCAGGVARVSVVSVAAKRELAFANAAGLSSVVVFPRAPAASVTFAADWGVANATGVVLPTLALGYDVEVAQMPNVCVWDPSSLATVPSCGVGFRAVPLGSVAPPTEAGYAALFREVGAAVHDGNGDGWQEVVLYFHALQLTVNVRPGASPTQFRRLAYDVGAADGVTVDVHSGRSYGVWALRVAGTTPGTFATLGIGGVPTGEFADYNCNVSRYRAMLGALGLMWSKYFSFASSTWSNYDAAQCGGVASGGLACLKRPGDFDHQCVHRFDNGIGVTADNVPFVALNVFLQTSPAATDNTARCLAEQYDLYQAPTWTPAKSSTWYGCVERKHQFARGTWSTQFAHLYNGTTFTGSQRTYVWGTTSQPLNGVAAGTFFVVEVQAAGEHAFDLSKSAAPAMQVKTMSKGLYVHVGTFPVAGRPKIRRAQPVDADIESLNGWNVGVASGSFVSLLTLRDVDGDGLVDVQLESGEWIGWRDNAFAVVTEPTTPPSTAATTAAAPTTATTSGDAATTTTTAVNATASPSAIETTAAAVSAGARVGIAALVLTTAVVVAS